jgi:hypothetical protein
MTTERFVRLFAGLFVLLSLALGVPASPIFVSQNFLWFTAFVGANLFQSALTRFCPLEIILRKLGAKSSAELAAR